jgi:ABC-type nickel/cobalt efflux system permease component RcnA
MSIISTILALFSGASPAGLSIPVILAIGFILGLFHGATPDEHTWPITFSYSVGSYSTRGGARAGLTFSAGFTAQRSILTALGFLGLAAVYTAYNLDGYVYLAVGFVMLVAGWYLLRGSDIHLPLDRGMERLFGPFFREHTHHTYAAGQGPPPEGEVRAVPLRMALVHGFVAGWGVGGFAVILIFVLAPQMPNVGWAALVGTTFGLGTMLMQIVTGALFARLARIKKLGEQQIQQIGRRTAARTLYVGGFAFMIVGTMVAALPWLQNYYLNTGNPVPNLNQIGYATVLVVLVVGVIGGHSLWKAYKEATSAKTGPPEGARRARPVGTEEPAPPRENPSVPAR